IRFHARSRSASVTPSTWLKRAIALRTCRASVSGSLRSLGNAKSLSASRSSSAVLRPSRWRGIFAPCARALCTSRALAMLRRAASFCRAVAITPPLYARGHSVPVRLPAIGVLIADGEPGSGVVDADHGAVPDVTAQQRPGDPGLDVPGDETAQRARAVDGIEALVRDEAGRLGRDLECHLALGQPGPQVAEHEI